MNKLCNHKAKNNNIFIANIICLLILIGLLMMFETTIKSDDYDLMMVLYGATTGDYSAFTMYTTVYFSSLIRILLTLAPNIAWYTVIQIIFIYMACVAIYIILMNQSKNLMDCVQIAAFIFIGYELYIRMTFTKTAGFLVAAGLMCILYVLEKKEKKITRILFYVIGVMFILVGWSIRPSMFMLVASVFFSSFIINLIKKDKKKIMLLVIWFLLLFILTQGAELLNGKCWNDNELWHNYNEKNIPRGRLQDYEMADYEQYKSYYDDMNFTENDYNAFHNWGLYNDYDYFASEKLNEIGKFNSPNGSASIFEKIEDISKSILKYYYGETSFYIYIMSVILVFSLLNVSIKTKMTIVIPNVALVLFAYMYMSYKGRLQHHVDVIVLITGFVLMYYYYCDYYEHSNKKVFASFLIIAVLFSNIFYSGINNSSYYDYYQVSSQGEKYSENKNKMNLLSQDKEHVYVFCAFDTNILYDCVFTPFEVIPKGYYSNLDMTNRYYIPDWDYIKSNYGINNYYKEATNSDTIRFVCCDENDEWIDVIKTFINEHYNESATYVKVNKYDNVNVYQFIE